MSSSSTTYISPEQNILQQTADFILKDYSEQAPDFTDLVIFLPHSHLSQRINEALCQSLEADGGAIIPPWSGTLKSWIQQYTSNPHSNYSVISEHARQLLFIEALQQYPNLFKEENQWQVTQALLGLFDELSLNQDSFFSSQEELQHQLEQAYGTEHEHLLAESKLVYTLWHAWQEQLNDNKLLDDSADYLNRLKSAHTNTNSQQQFICLGLEQYTKIEKDFIQNLIDKNKCHIIEYTSAINIDNNKVSDYANFINESCAQSSHSIKQRAIHYKENHLNISVDNIPFSTYLASNEEEQIRAIDYYVRLQTLDGKNNIAIISEDRKLSRRLRALLERANIKLQDNAGWSLATTQAATVIERWLECIEEDFSAYPLLDCLKSPFIKFTETDNNHFKKNIYRFEHDLIFHENVSRNISKYKAKLKERLQRLDHWPANAYDELIDTLTFIHETAKPLSELYATKNKIHLSEFIDSLFGSLQRLGVIQGYQNDDAGLLLLKTFETLKQSITYSNPTLSWYDCRIWLGLALESQNFTPATDSTNVQLITLEQASHQNFDCIVIAASESQHFPGSAKTMPFFNQAVRASLGLTTWKTQRQQRHELFNRTLLSAPDILLTACNEEKGEEKPISPWLELLINFYQLVFDNQPNNLHLQKLVQSNTEVFNCDDSDLPENSIQPSPAIPEALTPERLSASAYQRIINCPYQYFSADGLQLRALEELGDELKKSDYGERIHLILQSFHSGHKKHGKAYSQKITEANRKDAEQYLSKLSEKIFTSDLDDNVLHRSWLYRWQKHIPAYIHWQIKNQMDWSLFLSEKNLEVLLNNNLNIYGRLDRIDQNNEDNTHAIIDYKTGKTARQEDVDTGENVQLSMYALLDKNASEVRYLSVDSSSQKVETKSSLSGENLETNREQNEQRLIEIFKQVKKNHPMNAWGDFTVCRFCNFSGLCRKAEWET